MGQLRLYSPKSKRRRPRWRLRLVLALQHLFNHQFKFEGRTYAITGGRWLSNRVIRQFLEGAGITDTVGRLAPRTIEEALLRGARQHYDQGVKHLGNRKLLALPDPDNFNALRRWLELDRPVLVTCYDAIHGRRLTLKNPPSSPTPDVNWFGGTTPD